MADDLQRDLGALEARMDQHEKQLDEIRGDVKTLLEYAARTKGGWLALATIGTVAGAVGAGVAKLVSIVKGAG